ncbi:hypothetical protein CRYUN_Cryun22dG0029100 [Craigia yunnanensis]
MFGRMPGRKCSLMAGYLQTGFSLEVLNLFKNMTLVDNLRSNEYIFTVVFSTCSESGKALEGRQCHGYVLKSSLGVVWDSVTYVTVFGLCACLKDFKFWVYLKSDVELDVFVNSAIINMYGKCGVLFNARKVLMGCDFGMWSYGLESWLLTSKIDALRKH